MGREYKENSIALGIVTGISDYGIFVKLDDDNTGLIHISEIGNHYVKDLSKYVQINELIRVRINRMTTDNVYSLSIKNVDYRITKQKGSKIVETPSGFNNLALHLDYWINRELTNLKNQKKL